MNQNNYPDIDDEVEVKEIIQAIWNEKYKIFITALIFFVIIFGYTLTLPNIYVSQSVLAPSKSDDSLSSKLGNYSSIANIAGIDLGGDSDTKTSEAIQRIISYDFFIKEFLPSIYFPDLVAVKNWDSENNTLIYEDKNWIKLEKDISDSKPVVEKVYFGSSKPTKQEAYEEYLDILDISEDSKTSFITISIEHVSPNIAANWVNIIIDKINNHMRELDKTVAENSINFLNISYQKTKLSDLKDAISGLLQEQIQVLMLAEANQDYVFKRITSPIASEEKSKPSRFLIGFFGFLLGFLLSTLYAIYRHFFISKES